MATTGTASSLETLARLILNAELSHAARQWLAGWLWAGWLAGRQAGRLAGWLAGCIDNHPFMRYMQAIISLRVGRADSLVEQ